MEIASKFHNCKKNENLEIFLDISKFWIFVENCKIWDNTLEISQNWKKCLNFLKIFLYNKIVNIKFLHTILRKSFQFEKKFSTLLEAHWEPLLDCLIDCFGDDSWPVRDATCIAAGNFVRSLPDKTRSKHPALYEKFMVRFFFQVEFRFLTVFSTFLHRILKVLEKSKICWKPENLLNNRIFVETSKICWKIENWLKHRKLVEKSKICWNIENLLKHRKLFEKSKICWKIKNLLKNREFMEKSKF